MFRYIFLRRDVKRALRCRAHDLQFHLRANDTRIFAILIDGNFLFALPVAPHFVPSFSKQKDAYYFRDIN